MKLMMLVVLLLAFLTVVPAQEKTRSQSAPVTKCKLGLEKAPALRGLKLGLTQAQFMARFPGVSLDRPNEFGLAGLGLSIVDSSLFPKSASNRGVQLNIAVGPAEGRSFTIDRSRFSEFKDVRNIQLQFVDGRIVSVKVAYDDTVTWDSVDEFVQTLSKNLDLPDEWHDLTDSEGDKSTQELNCEGFRMTAKVGGDANDTRVAAQVTVEDSSSMQLIAKRQKDKEDKLKRTEEERRKTFKP
jgi:hypothetical protein